MEEFNYEIINIFNKNFICNDVKKIIKLYKTDITFFKFSDTINLKVKKYHHPLFRNYNYCFFCNEKRKTKYNSNSLEISHIEMKEKTIGEYLSNNNIKLREVRTKKDKIAKRKFINSYDNFIKNDKYYYNQIPIKPNNESDTELYVYDKEENQKNQETIEINNLNKNSNKSNKMTNFKKMRKMKKSITKDYNDIKIPKNTKKIKYENSINDSLNSSRGKSSVMNKSSERKINLNESTKIEHQINLKNLKIGSDSDDDNADENIIQINNNINNNNSKEDDKETDDYIMEIKNRPSPRLDKKNKDVNIIESTNINSDSKKEIAKLKSKSSKLNRSTEENIDKIKEKEESNKNKLLEVFKETKNFFLGKRASQGKNFINNRMSLDDNQVLNKNQTVKNPQNFIEKNDNCSICLSEIKEKFTLLCGDFFCRDCIRTTILTAMKEIINLDKLVCPTCHENIEENTVKKLLTEEEFIKYENLVTKITGLINKKKDLIPCPYPDCPGWTNECNNNIVCCQYAHSFCKKCLCVVDKEDRLKDNEHHCYENLTPAESKTLEFFKENQNFRKCPNCQSMVVREGGGCNNMTCTNIWCGYEFCWICNSKYEDSHYKNPLSMCFGLSETNYDGKLAKYSRVRFFRCFLIFLLIIFVILPVIVTFFSIFEAFLFVITFVLDGSAMKNIKLNSQLSHKAFYKIAYGFYIAIGVAYIPFGYVSLVVLVVFTPIICIVNKIRNKNDEDLE